MKAYVIVYAPTTFTVGGDQPLRRLRAEEEQNYSYADSPSAIEPGRTAKVDPGIYGLISENDEVTPEIQPAESARVATDYDIVMLYDKDPWPYLTAEQVQREQVQRTRAAFSQVSDEKLAEFLPPRAV